MLIKRKLPIISILIVFFAMLLSGIVYYVYIYNLLEENNERQMKQITEMGSIAFENFFTSRKIELSYLAKNANVQETLSDYVQTQEENSGQEPLYDHMNRVFEDLRNINHDISHAFILGLDGRVVASSHPDSLYIDLSDRQYYQDALIGKTTVSNLLQDRVDGQSVLFGAGPVYDIESGKLLGVVCTIIDSGNASRSITELIDPSYGVAYLMTIDGTIIFHIDEEMIGTLHQMDELRPLISEVGQNPIVFEHEHVGESFFVAIRKVVNTPWYLVIEQKKSLLQTQSTRILNFIGLVFILLMGIVVYISLAFAKSITGPISELGQVMERTSRGDLSSRSEYRVSNELGDLSRNLNHMLDELVGAYEEVEDKNEELIAVEEELRNNNNQLEESQMEIKKVAFRNPLSKIPNRLAFGIDMKALIEADPHKENPFSVYEMDVDNFMRINDSLGHRFGDQILIEIGERLETQSGHGLKFYHLSADEFAFIDQESHDEDSIKARLDSIYSVFYEPFEVKGRTLYLAISTGISTYPNDGVDAEVIIQNADTAMFEAKAKGKGSYVFYKKIMSEAVQTRIEIEELLREAVANQLVYFQLQPQYPTDSSEKISFEALMRMVNYEGDTITPYIFIPIAEETGQIIELGYWILDKAAELIALWRDKDYDFGHISVNVSGVQLKQLDFIDHVKAIVDKHGVSPGDIELEVTESVLVNNYENGNNHLSMLKDLGFKIALDDFGTGYSSFSYLSYMPLTTLKIDKSFIDNIATSKRDNDLIRQMIEIAHDLNLLTVAEGVEDKNQVDILRSYQCDYIQGYYYSKPIDVSDVLEKLQNKDWNS